MAAKIGIEIPGVEATHYPNLYYCCVKCIQHQAGTWPSPDQLVEVGLRFADPCEEDMYLEHLRESADGTLEYLTNCGRLPPVTTFV